MKVRKSLIEPDARWKRRLRKFKEDYRNGEKSLDDIMLSMNSYHGHLSHGHTYKLQKKVMKGFVLSRELKDDGGAGEDEGSI